MIDIEMIIFTFIALTLKAMSQD